MRAKIISFEHIPNGTRIFLMPSFFIGDEERSLDVSIKYDDFLEMFKRWQDGANVQNAFSTLDADEREFLMTGMLPEEWEEMFGEDNC
jgi:hypothetical protein